MTSNYLLYFIISFLLLILFIIFKYKNKINKNKINRQHLLNKSFLKNKNL